ncbi:conserved hypothetical secreted protein [Pseudoalteromonas luteoviolacea B = ATCC 29581]|nr:conserved hypothetical secreted protein [Pseudoalteromonas luteoviolacea B = ATCC 29581]
MKRAIVLFSIAMLSAFNLFASPGAHGPNGEHLDQTAKASDSTLGKQADGSVIMPMKHQAMLGIKTEFVTVSKVEKHFQLDAIVNAHPDGYAKIQSSSDGRLDMSEMLSIRPTGTLVKAGDVLGLIRYQDTAYELASQTSELIAIRNRIDQTNRDVERLKKLGDLASKQVLEQLEADLQSLKQQAKALQTGLEKPEVLIAPISGRLINHNVSRGQWVEAGATLFEIIAPNKLILAATTNDRTILPKLTVAQIVEQPSLEFKFVGYSPMRINGLTQVNFELTSNVDDANLLLNENVTLRVPINEIRQGIVLPAEAVVLSSNHLPQVWIKLSAERFLPQVVKYEVLQPGKILITDGLGEDNRVVITGASLLNQVR